MVLVAGLGNPGRKYAKTRHNSGFRVVDKLSEEYRISLKETDLYAYGKGTIGGREVALVKPLTFMNRSGSALREMVRKLALSPDAHPESLIVVHDDLDIETGQLRIRKNGSSGGHKGIESIIQEIGTKAFIRVKIGIGRDRDVPVEEYVLSNIPASEKRVIDEAIENAAEAITLIVTEGVGKAMTKFNRSTGLPRTGPE